MNAASYHSSRGVRALRWALPAVALCVLIGVVSVPLWHDWQAQLAEKNLPGRLKIEGMGLAQNAKGEAQLQVSAPEFSGRDASDRPYRVTAEKVTQGLHAGDEMTLAQPKAALTLQDKPLKQLLLNAQSGVYDPDAKKLNLQQDVQLRHSDGTVLYMQDLDVDLAAGTAVSAHPVSGEGPQGTLQAASLELRERGAHLILHGPSRLVLNLSAASEAKQ